MPRQRKPYPPLAEVASHQRVFELDHIDGTIVGFRFPDYAAGIDVPGYHLHFIADDRASGGHVLDGVLGDGRVALDPSSELHLELPAGVELHGPGGEDRSRLVEQIEGGERA